MPYIGDTIETLRNRLKNWLIYSSTESHVENLDLDLLNRAQSWLVSYRWGADPLITTYTLTLSGSNEATCPSDLKTILEVYCDSTIPGYPDIHFYENHNDVAQRYTKYYTHNNGTGGYWTIVFPSVSPVLSSPKLKYAVFLSDYTGTGDEYSYFPGELLLRTAQKIFAEEMGITGEKVDRILTSHIENIRNYETSIVGNNMVPDLTPKDHYGRPIHIAGYKLDGSDVSNRREVLSRAQAAGIHGY